MPPPGPQIAGRAWVPSREGLGSGFISDPQILFPLLGAQGSEADACWRLLAIATFLRPLKLSS